MGLDKRYPRSLSDGKRASLPFFNAGESFNSNHLAPTAGNSLIVEVQVVATAQRLLRRVFLSGTAAPKRVL